jgi:hypothetical protein
MKISREFSSYKKKKEKMKNKKTRSELYPSLASSFLLFIKGKKKENSEIKKNEVKYNIVQN